MKTRLGVLIVGLIGLSGLVLYSGSGDGEASAAASTDASALIVSVSPPPNSASAGPDSPIMLTLGEPLDVAAFEEGSLSVFARWSGVMKGRVTLEAGGTQIRFVPGQPFQAGEWVTASLRRGTTLADGGTVETGYIWNFWIRPEPGSIDMIDRGGRLVMNEDETHVQPYGAYAGDFNSDGYPDLAIPNEVSGDMRIMLNDGRGNYEDFSILEIPDGSFPSPNEGADFNGDGTTDFVVGNAGNDLVTVFLGDGEGWFKVGQNYQAGDNVRGVCVMDLNHDGWPDVATANWAVGPAATRGNVAILLNEGDGSGRLRRTASIPSPGRGEKTCAVGDANGDGHPDLFVGALWSGEVLLYLGVGVGGLDLETRVAGGGGPWMIAAGDLNGDGNVDVVAANRGSNFLARAGAPINNAYEPNVAVLLGDGAGHLADPVQYELGQDATLQAVDIGDLDGDGDLDVVASDFGANRFIAYENAGDGTLVRPRNYPAGKSGSCVIIHDRDRDGDLDITGVDETDNKIFLLENPGAER